MSHGDLDARVRSGLLAAGEPLDDLDVAGALDVVLRTSERRRGTRRAALLVAAAAVLVGGVSTLSVVAGGRSESPEPLTPAVPSGTYQRDVDSGGWRGEWSMTLRPARVLDLAAPPDVSAEQAPTDGTSYVLGETTFTVDAFANGVCFQAPPGTYSWSLVEGGLLLRADQETCPERRRVFEGLWQGQS